MLVSGKTGMYKSVDTPPQKSVEVVKIPIEIILVTIIMSAIAMFLPYLSIILQK